MDRWRLLLDGAASGALNMGVDEALLDAVVQGGAPTLRFYTWREACLSLGYAQTLSARRGRACRAAGVPVVRRPTGGGAVLHGGDLTYAIAAPEGCLPDGLRASYAVISQGLCAALRALGVPALRRAPGVGRRAVSFDCFALAAADEICARGHKLVGSAQRRRAGGLLQHGSIRLRPDAPRASQAAGLDGDAATSLHELGLPLPLETVRDACVEHLGHALGATFALGCLGADEREWARTRAREHAASALPNVGEPPRESQGGLSATDR